MFTRQKIILVLLVVCMSTLAEKIIANDGRKNIIRIEKISQRKLDRKVKDIVFGKEAKTENIYPKVMITEDSIEFLDEKGNIKKTKSMQKVKVKEWITESKDGKTVSRRRERLDTRGYIAKSKNGKAFGVWEATEIDEDKNYVTNSKFTLFNEEGDIVWETDKLNGGEGGPSFEVSEDGETVVVNHFIVGSGSLEFYNSKGLVKKFQPLGTRFDNGYIDFSGDGKLCAVVVSEPSQWLLLYDNLGNELWRRELGGDSANKVAVSYNGEIILATIFTHNPIVCKTICYDKEGNKLWELKGWQLVESPEDIINSFSKDYKYALLSSLHRDEKIALVELSSGQIIWEHNYVYDKGMKRNIFINTTEISKDGKIVIVGIGLRKEYDFNKKKLKESNKPRKIFVFDKKGNILNEIEVESNPIVEIIGDKIIISSSGGVLEYNIKGKLLNDKNR